MREINKVYNEDCLEGMKKIKDKSINLIITSPPYNMNDKRYYKNYEDNKNDYNLWLKEIFIEFKRILSDHGVICFNISYNKNSKSNYIKIINNALDIGLILQETVSWYKKGMPLTEIRNFTRDFEFIFILSKNNDYYTNQKKDQIISNVWEIKNNNIHTEENRACFPLGLPKKCIDLFSKEGDLVLDCFMGSGTTAVASYQSNRKFIGFELDIDQFKIINSRLSQKTLFESLLEMRVDNNDD